MNYFEIFKQLSIIKTLWFNLYYFGLGTLIKNGPYCFIAKNVKISCMKGQVIVRNPKKHRIRLGFAFDISYFDRRYERFIWHNTGTIVFNGHGQIYLGCRIENLGYLEFGENIECTASTTFICHKKIVIGDNCGISWKVLVMDTDYHSITDENGTVINKNDAIIINDEVWISCNVIILKGTEINSQSIVAAGSILSGKKFTEQNIIIGGTGKILKRNIFWNPEGPN
ncbi:MAG: hypothetical protein ACOWWH_13000 [Eubacteriaceae bacterium]